MLFLFFKQKTAYEMRMSDWSSDVCSSDLLASTFDHGAGVACPGARSITYSWPSAENAPKPLPSRSGVAGGPNGHGSEPALSPTSSCPECAISSYCVGCGCSGGTTASGGGRRARSEEHTSELQSLMRISYAVFCLKKKKKT